MTHQGRSKVAAFAALAAVVIAAMGGVVATASRADAQILDEIKKRGKIVVGTEAAYPPFEFVKDGKIVGYGKDILDHCVAKLGVQLEQLDLPMQGMFAGLEAKRYDFVATAVGMWPDRQSRFAFTMPIAEGAGSVMTRAGDGRIKSANDLSGMIVGSQTGSAMERVAKQFEEKLKAAGRPSYKEYRGFTRTPEAYLALANGTVDAVVQNSTQIRLIMAEKPGVYQLVERIADPVYIGWIARPDSKDLRDFFNGCIRELNTSGRLAAMQDKWFGFRMELPVEGYLAPGAH